MIIVEQTINIPMTYPLLMIKAPKGLLVCGYIALSVFEEAGDVVVQFSDVNTVEDMFVARVHALTRDAMRLGVRVGMTGWEAIKCLQ